MVKLTVTNDKSVSYFIYLKFYRSLLKQIQNLYVLPIALGGPGATTRHIKGREKTINGKRNLEKYKKL